MSQRQREEGKGRDDAANDEGTKERGKSHALMPDAASASAAEQQGNSVREERHGSADPSLSLLLPLFLAKKRDCEQRAPEARRQTPGG